MSRLLTNRRLFVLLAGFILLMILAGLTLKTAGIFVWPERALLDVNSAVSSIVYPPVSKVSGFLQGVKDLRSMYQENAQLKSQLIGYQQLDTELKSEKQTISDLRAMLHFANTASSAFSLISADVVGRDPSTWHSVVTIDVGRRNQVKTGMAVIGPDGSLIGKITVAGELSSKVSLITDSRLGDGVSAVVQTKTGKPPFGIVVGSTSVGGDLEMGFLSPLSNVRPGDMVTTSGLSAQFPRGLLIGSIMKVGPSSGGVTQYAMIQPSADMEYLQHVFVVQSGGSPQ